MKKQFLNPEMEVVWLKKLDVVACSTEEENGVESSDTDYAEIDG